MPRDAAALAAHLRSGFRLPSVKPPPDRRVAPGSGLPLSLFWSGGKDTCHALHRAYEEGLAPRELLCLIEPGGSRAHWHTASRALLGRQARALGLPIRFLEVTARDYARVLERACAAIARRGPAAIGFGYIEPTEHRHFAHALAGRCGLRVFEPNCGRDQLELLREQLSRGYEILVTSVDAARMDPAWAGRRLDVSFIEYVRASGISPCGEAGEFHTFVLDGPRFSRRIEVLDTRAVEAHGGRHVLIRRSRLAPKR